MNMCCYRGSTNSKGQYDYIVFFLYSIRPSPRGLNRPQSQSWPKKGTINRVQWVLRVAIIRSLKTAKYRCSTIRVYKAMLGYTHTHMLKTRKKRPIDVSTGYESSSRPHTPRIIINTQIPNQISTPRRGTQVAFFPNPNNNKSAH